MDYNKIIGSNIRYERQKRDLTIEELSEILNIAPGFLGLIERGQRGTSIKNLCKIANFFSINLDQLITKSLFDPTMTTIVAEDPESQKALKHTAAVSLIHNLDEEELDFIINTIKNLRKYSKAKLGMSFEDEEPEEE